MRGSLLTIALLLFMCCPVPSPALGQPDRAHYPGGDGPGAGRSIVLISGDEEYRSEEAFPQLARILSERHGFDCTVLFAIDRATGQINPDDRTNIPGLETLADADLMVIATRFRDLPDAQMAHIDAYVRSGRPIIGLRTATHAFNIPADRAYHRYSWNTQAGPWVQGFGRAILGETWIAHHGAHGAESCRGIIPANATDHPINRGIAPKSIWGPTDVYRVRLPLPGDSFPVVLGAVLDGMNPDDNPVANDKNDPMMPISWTRTYEGADGRRARVFTTTMGAATDFVADGTRRMFVNATYWCLGMEDRIPPGGTDARLVGDYAPTEFGFGGFVKGRTPADYMPAPPAPAGTRLDLPRDATVLIAGNTFAERVAQHGRFDALIQATHPGRAITVRQVPWSADEVGIRPRERDVPTLEDHIARIDPDILMLCFGMSESFGGDGGLAAFRDDLRAMLREHQDRTIVLVGPIRHQRVPTPTVSDAARDAHNRDLGRYNEAMRAVARASGCRFVDLFTVDAPAGMTTNGIHPSAAGSATYARAIGQQLGWLTDTRTSVADRANAARLLSLALAKHDLERLLYRPTNTEYIWGRRHKPFGIVNFPPEMEQLERMIEARDRAMHEIRLQTPGSALDVSTLPSRPERFPEDAWTPDPVEAKGTETSLGSTDILPPAEFAESFTLPDGYRIDCFASEQDFPELRSPLAMTFDSRHRLWVLCAGTYPHLLPGNEPECQLLILEDTDGDGRADRRTIFADRLYVPTGFAVDTDAVYLGQAPDLLRLRDTDGDDRADVTEIVASGFSMPDSHHQLSAFEWDPSGAIVMHEGVFGVSGVETPHGTRRARDAAVWRFDPRTERLDIISHCGFANPWGHVFEDTGLGLLADASGGSNYISAHIMIPFRYPAKPARTGHFLNRGRPTAGCELIASRHFPEDVQDSFLVNQSIGFHGTRWDATRVRDSGRETSSMPMDLVTCSDVNFRPVGIETGPDGAIYILDWCNPIVGHMQYSVRDPRRDSTHGRVWRVTHTTRPLVDPPELVGASVPTLLELLRLPERNTRQLARRHLQRTDPSVVLPAAERWLAELSADDAIHDRAHLETLWLQASHGRVDSDRLRRTTSLSSAGVRAGAVRLMRHLLRDTSLNEMVAIEILDRTIADPDMRVRLESIGACAWLPSDLAMPLLERAAATEMDDGTRKVFEGVITYLHPAGTPESTLARRIRLRGLPADALLDTEMDPVVASVMLERADLPLSVRGRALTELAGSDPAARADTLVSTLASIRSADSVPGVTRLLNALPRARLEPHAETLQQLAAARDHPASPGASSLLWRLEAPHAAPSPLVLEASALTPRGQASQPLIDAVRATVESEPRAAIQQLVRHERDRAALFEWLSSLASRAGTVPFDDWSEDHELSMAAVEGMNRLNPDPWPADWRFRRPRPDADRLARGEAIYFDEAIGCVNCHGRRGEGAEGFPALAGSPWVLGEPRRAAAIVMHGLRGPVTMPNGTTYDSAMAPLGPVLSDDQIADVLTYVRSSWGNYAPPVTPSHAQAARNAPPETGGAWEASLLLARYPLDQDTLIPVVDEGGKDASGGSGAMLLALIGALILTVLLGFLIVVGHALIGRRV